MNIEAVKAEKRAESERAAAEKMAKKKADALEREAAESERKAKLAAEKAEGKVKAPALVKEEDIVIVDMNMPSYSGATDSKAKSKFAL